CPDRTAHSARGRVWLPRRAGLRAGGFGTARPCADRGPRAPPPRHECTGPARTPAEGKRPARRTRPGGRTLLAAVAGLSGLLPFASAAPAAYLGVLSGAERPGAGAPPHGRGATAAAA